MKIKKIEKDDKAIFYCGNHMYCCNRQRCNIYFSNINAADKG